MARTRMATMLSSNRFTGDFLRAVKSAIFCILILSHQCVALPQSTHATSAPSGKLGAHMLRQPESTIAPLKDEVLFECGLNLTPDRLEWRFRPQHTSRTASYHVSNNDNINDFIYLSENGNSNITTEDGVSKLRVYVSQQSVGEYQCVAWFGTAALASVPAKLLLADISLNGARGSVVGSAHSSMEANRRMQPPQVAHWKVSPGNSILIHCGEVASNPPPVWTFYKDDEPLSNLKPRLPNGGLILQEVTPADAGTYSCSAMNSITAAEVKMPQKFVISVTEMRGPPSFLVAPPSLVSIRPGATAILECPGIGAPTPKAVWSRPEAPISNNRTSLLSYGLQILDARSEDRGTYVCRLDNGIAPVLVHTIQLEVLEAPTILHGPIDTLTDEGESLELDCVAKGYPTPSIYWLINGIDTRYDRTVRANGTKLLIRSIEKKHAGIVQCFAKNDVAEVYESKLLQVKPKQISGESGMQPLGTIPHTAKANNYEHSGKSGKGKKKHKHTVMVPPSRPNITRLSDEKVMVRWSVPSRESLPIQFFKVQYRSLGATPKATKRSQWMTSNEDIPPNVRMYEVDNLKPNNYYRFRIAAVYSNNDNQLSNVSKNFLLLRGSQLDPTKSHLIAPNLTSVEPISETAVVLHWLFPARPTTPVDGFYAYYRPASTAGEYYKATVDGMDKRHFKIENLEPGTAYEFKLQSYTSSAASDFLAIITGKTLKPSTQSPIDPNIITQNGDAAKVAKPYVLLVAGATVAASVLLMAFISLCIFMKRRKKANLDDDTHENKAHPDHIQAETNGFPVGSGGGNGRILSSPGHKNSRLNGVVPRMNITANPLATDGDKNRNVMELRFLPTSLPGVAAIQQQNNNCDPSTGIESHRRTLDRSIRNINQHGLPTAPMTVNNQQHPSVYPNTIHDNGMGSTGDIGIAHQTDLIRRTPRRTTTGNGIPVPASPRFMRAGISNGISNDMLHHNRSPIPSRVAAAVAGKRNRLGRLNDNISSASLNSIEV